MKLVILAFMAALLSGQELPLPKLPELPKDVVVADVAQSIKNKDGLVTAKLFSQDEKRFLLLILDPAFVDEKFYQQFFFASGLKTGLGISAHGRANMMAHGQNIEEYLKGNRDSFHKLLGVTRIDFVGISACNNGGGRNTDEMRGLGYLPEYRQAAYANTSVSNGSTMATLSIFLKEKKSMKVTHHEGGRKTIFEVGDRGLDLDFFYDAGRMLYWPRP
jgi:hypothetical protein